jgi:hypothetical protein
MCSIVLLMLLVMVLLAGQHFRLRPSNDLEPVGSLFSLHTL